jgi:hypothetical protein
MSVEVSKAEPFERDSPDRGGGGGAGGDWVWGREFDEDVGVSTVGLDELVETDPMGGFPGVAVVSLREEVARRAASPEDLRHSIKRLRIDD